jgi:hypothetical protein
MTQTSFFDSASNERCELTSFCDGTTRCVPKLPSPVSSYSDPGCTQPVAVLQYDPNCPAPPTPTRVLFDRDKGCYDLDAVRPVGAPITPTALWSDATADGSCVNVSSTAGTPGWGYFALGAAVPVDTFVTIQTTVE